jgi:DNA polymerase I
MYLTPTDKHWACDIEADNLLDKATRIWCCCVENVVTGEKKEFTDARDFLEWFGKDIILVGHNFIAYDLVMLNRFWSVNCPVSRVVDTYVLSQLYNPVFAGGHSLEAWGERLRFPKGDFNDFSRLSKEMVEYCSRDTGLTARLYNRLSGRMLSVGFSEDGVETEHLAWNIIQNKQRRHGFPFNKQKAEVLYAELRSREEELRKEIHSLWPPELCVVGEFKRAVKKDGHPTALYQRHREQYPRLELTDDGGYRAYDYVSFNLGSPPQRIQKLLELGWTPTQWTVDKKTKEKKNPKIDEDSILAFADKSGKKEVTALAKWLVVNSRANMVRTWLEAYDDDTGAIHGKLFIASTLRYRHSNPNSANIPAVRTDKEDNVLRGEVGTWAYECRELFDCGDTDRYSLVGVDAKGIQIRILLNYAFSEDAVRLYTEGDPHVDNAKLLGLANKPAAKKFFYTLIMGGGGARLAADQLQFGTRLSPSQGDAMKQKMIASIPGFSELIQSLQSGLQKTGRIRLCDGTPILVPSPHMVIPYLLQGDESRIMKKAMIELDREIRRHGVEASKVGDIHDEWQFVVANEDVERFSRLALDVFPRVGKFFSYKVPIEGSVKVGKTWAETH